MKRLRADATSTPLVTFERFKISIITPSAIGLWMKRACDVTLMAHEIVKPSQKQFAWIKELNIRLHWALRWLNFIFGISR